MIAGATPSTAGDHRHALGRRGDHLVEVRNLRRFPIAIDSTSVPFTDTSSSVSPSDETTDERIVLLIVSPVASAEAMIAVPSIRPVTMRAVRARRRGRLRRASLTKIQLRT